VRRGAGAAILAVLLSACSVPPVQPSPDVVAAQAPTGTLRAAINVGNPVLARRDAATGEARGVSVDLSRELARRLGVPLALVTVPAAANSVEAIASGTCDVAYVAIDPARAVDLDYSAPYVVIEGVYLVPQGSPIQNNAQVDRQGVRVVVGAASAYDLYLARELKHAQIVRVPTSAEVVPTLVARQLEVAPARWPVHGHQPGAGHRQGPPGRRPLSGRVHRGHESLGICRRRLGAERRRGRRRGAAGRALAFSRAAGAWTSCNPPCIVPG
jgi:polar amino acid transport system substrate-binding protein